VQQWQGEKELSDTMGDLLTWIENKVKTEPELSTDPKAVQQLRIMPSTNKDLKKASRNILKNGWDLGQEHAENEVMRAEGPQFERNVLKQFNSLGDAAANYLKAREFTMAGKLSTDSLSIIQNVLFNGIKFSKSTDEIVDDIYSTFATKGLISREDAEEALGAALDVKNPSARLETTVRTNLFDSMNESRFNFFTDPDLGGFVTALSYSAILDGRTTPICRELGGETSPNNKPFEALAGSSEWDVYRPPNHFNCRSLLIPVTARDEIEINTWNVQNEPLEGFQ
jgi:SPP1 gp7 family putative phage head morphogenesis protein